MSSQHIRSDKSLDGINNIFITGTYRSGTTLLEKILHNHKNISVASQPFPLLYIYLKGKFNNINNISTRYPLDHMFLNRQYTTQKFKNFLKTYELDKKLLKRIFEDLHNYIGLWTPEVLKYESLFKPGYFNQIYNKLNKLIGELFPKERMKYVGSKEILCEEYIPYLLSQGNRVILIIRDPRDMITSLNFRKRDNQTGKKRPVLYSLRVWRKSVAFAIEYKDHPNFLYIRYEDLVRETFKIINMITDFLNVNEIDNELLDNGIYDQYNNLWLGNSSFSDKKEISASSIGKFKDILPKQVIVYIENCCLPEMKYMGYNCFIKSKFNKNDIINYKEPFSDIHKKFPTDYSSSEKHIKEEIKRYKIIHQDLLKNSESIRKWFIFEKVYEILKNV